MNTKTLPCRLAALVTALLAVTTSLAATYLNNDEYCGSCHPAQYQKHSQSIHLQMIRPATGADLVNVHGNLSAPKAPTPAEFSYVIGGWYKEESYLKVEQIDGTNKYTVINYEWNPIRGTYANDKPMRDWLVKCAGCHTTGYEVATRSFQDFNIHCESCHGPSAEHADRPSSMRPIKDTSSEGCGHCHIRAESAATPDYAAKTFNFPIGYELGNPASLKFIPEPITAATSFYPDGRSNRHRQQYLDTHYPGVRVTKHYEMNISCTKCHDPHSSGTVTVHSEPAPAGKFGVKIYNNVTGAIGFSEWDGEGLKTSRADLCVGCHTTVRNDHVHAFNPVAASAAAEGKVSCVDCHMPDIINIDPVTLRGALHTHTYNTARPENAVRLGAEAQPNSCTYRCHQDKGATKTERAQWASTYTGVVLAAGGGTNFELHLKGLKDFLYRIEGTTDFRNWTPIATERASDGQIHLQGETADQYLFYRAVEQKQAR